MSFSFQESNSLDALQVKENLETFQPFTPPPPKKSVSLSSRFSRLTSRFRRRTHEISPPALTLAKSESYISSSVFPEVKKKDKETSKSLESILGSEAMDEVIQFIDNEFDSHPVNETGGDQKYVETALKSNKPDIQVKNRNKKPKKKEKRIKF